MSMNVFFISKELVENIGPAFRQTGSNPSRLLFHPLVENIGVEPMTSCVQGRRSSQLS